MKKQVCVDCGLTTKKIGRNSHKLGYVGFLFHDKKKGVVNLNLSHIEWKCLDGVWIDFFLK